MAPVTDEELDREYDKNGVEGVVPADHIKKMRAIAKALTDVKLMKWALKYLSDKMVEEYKTRVDNSVAQGVGWKQVKAAMEKADREESDISRHLLTTVLTGYGWRRTHGQRLRNDRPRSLQPSHPMVLHVCNSKGE